LLGHKGRHTNAYWTDLLKRANTAIKGLQKGTAEYVNAVKTFLHDKEIKLVSNPELLTE
jgi:hypothetical protein